jgi:hypothetical protein
LVGRYRKKGLEERSSSATAISKEHWQVKSPILLTVLLKVLLARSHKLDGSKLEAIGLLVVL